MNATFSLAPMNAELDFKGKGARSLEPALLRRLETALGVLRAGLVECATQDDWSEQRSVQLTEMFRACVRQMRSHGTVDAPAVDARLPRSVLRQAVRFVNEHLDAKLTWEDIASVCGMEPFAFGRRFKLSTGLTVRRYVICCRLRHAMNLLLNSKLGLSAIALEAGFSCQSHMTTLFRQHLDTTPGAVRMRSARSGTRVAAAVTPGRNALPPTGAMAAGRSLLYLMRGPAGATAVTEA